jgi:branched-chain amino acid transport system substrate-binding protein
MKTVFMKPRYSRIAIPALLIGSCLAISAAEAQECEVKLGVAGPMSGGGASWGLTQKAGTEFEAAWTNSQGGLQVGSRKCKVSVVSFDSQGTASGGAATSNSFASQNVHAVVGPIVAPEMSGFKPVAKRNGQVNFSPSFAADVISPDFPLAFHQVQAPAVWGPLTVKAVKEHFNIKSAVVVGPNDQGGTDPGKALAKLYNDSGIQTSTEWYQRGTTNFAPIVARLMSMKADAVEFGPMPPGEAGILAKQLLEAGYPGAFGKLGSGGDAMLKNSGGAEKQNAFYWFEHVPTEDPSMKKMKADFERLMKGPLPENTLVYNAQISAEQLLKAISRAGGDQDGEKIAAELRKMSPESRYLGKSGWRGKAQYGINQELAFPVSLNFVVKGKMQPQVKLEIPSEPPADR